MAQRGECQPQRCQIPTSPLPGTLTHRTRTHFGWRYLPGYPLSIKRGRQRFILKDSTSSGPKGRSIRRGRQRFYVTLIESSSSAQNIFVTDRQTFCLLPAFFEWNVFAFRHASTFQTILFTDSCFIAMHIAQLIFDVLRWQSRRPVTSRPMKTNRGISWHLLDWWAGYAVWTIPLISFSRWQADEKYRKTKLLSIYFDDLPP